MKKENYLSCVLLESQTDEKCTTEVTLIKKPDDIEYDRAVLHVAGNPVGVFDDKDMLRFQPQQFGDIECEIIFFKGDASVWEVSDQILSLNIETWFVAAHPDLGHSLVLCENGKTVELFARQRARGNNDICFRLVVRVPMDEEITITHSITKEDDTRPKYNKPLEIHYRGAEYKDRNNLYTPPDEAMYHIDEDREKWLPMPLTLGHGIHVIYIVPSCKHDLSYLSVMGVNSSDTDNDFRFSFTGFFKTIL